MNKNLIYILLVILAGVGVYAYTNKPTTTLSPEVTVTEDAMMETTKTVTKDEVMEKEEVSTIKYTDEGFEPQSVTVKVGSTVTFVNESDLDMWVASALHPTHLELPGFDQLKGEPKGSTYSFTFEKKGTWKFHDHLTPKFYGSVVVE